MQAKIGALILSVMFARAQPLILIFLLFSLQFAGVCFYLSFENTVHFWDYAMYARLAREWFLTDSLPEKWGTFRASFQNNYNLLFAVPSLFSFTLFGASRTVFILTNLAVFAFPAQIALGFLAHRLAGFSKTHGVLFAVALCCLIPSFWAPLLQGYPEPAAALCLFAAFVLALDARKDWQRALGIGTLLALAVVLRRHFAYPALAFIAAHAVAFLWKNRNSRPLLRGPFLTYFGALGLAALGLLALAQPHYLLAMVAVDFTALYASYRRAPSEYLVYLLAQTGLLWAVCGTLGIYFLAREKKYKIVPFFPSFFVFWLGAWAFGPAQIGDHYLSAVLPLFCFLGALGFLCAGFFRCPQGLLLVLLCVQMGAVFFPHTPLPLPSDPPQIGLFATPRPPWRRNDLDALRALAADIAETTLPEDRVMLAASSFVLNQDLLRAVYIGLLGDVVTPALFLPIPETDGQEAARAPDIFASANVYLLPEAPAFHLPEDRQRVVKALWLAAANPDFQKEKQRYVLDRDVSVSVVRRPSWTGPALFKALAPFENVGSWVVARGAPWGMFTNNDDDVFSFRGALSLRAPLLSLFYNTPLSSGKYRLGLTFDLAPSCKAFDATLRVEDSRGRVLYEHTGVPPQNPGVYFWPFIIKNTAAPGFVFLSFSSLPQQSCLFSAASLVFEKSSL